MPKSHLLLPVQAVPKTTPSKNFTIVYEFLRNAANWQTSKQKNLRQKHIVGSGNDHSSFTECMYKHDDL